MKRIALGIEYDGQSWLGWQTQPNGRTVQDRLQDALARFACTPIAVTCAGRTDTGVHALEQVVHFDTTLTREAFSWVRGVNAFLPASIAVRWAAPVAQDFHARFSARGRSYSYLLYNHAIRSPLAAGRAGWCFRPLDVDAMRAGAAHLLGEHDFSAFRSSECQANSPVRTLYRLDVARHGDLVEFNLHGNAFLHHMVRNIVGALIEVGKGRQAPEWMAWLLHGRERALAAPTFMPDGLYLAGVDYDAKWGLPQEARAARVLLPRP